MFDSMTLEDFFALTEMKNGFTTLARVEELICVMQNQTAYATSNVGDAARQWATVATTLASTENQDCLNHFVQLNGLCFLNQWLQEAVKCTQEATDASEWINFLFGSLEKLAVDREKLSDSGILLTVEKLLSHETADIKLRAQTLFARWNTERINDDCCQGNTERINDDCCQNLEEGCLNLVESSKHSADATSVQDKHGEDKNADSSPCQTAVEEGSCWNESGRIGKLRARSPNSLHSNNTDDGLKGSIPHQTMKMNSSEEKEKSALNPIPALDSSSFEEKLSVDESSVALVGMASSSAPFSPKVLVKDDDECSTSATKTHSEIDAKMNTGIGNSYDLGQRDDECSTSGTKNHNEIDAEMNTGIGNSYDFGQRDSFCVSTGRPATSPEEKPMVCSASAILESKGAGNLSDDDGSLLRQESIGAANEDNLLLNEPALKECKDPPKISKYKVAEELSINMDLDPESGEFDALEFARQIAFEAEREVVDYREQSCSSSTEVSSGDIVDTAVPDIAQNKHDQLISGLPNGNGSVSGKDNFDIISSPRNDNCKVLEVTTDVLEVKQSLKSPNHLATNQKTTKCDFDLNVEVFSEDFECTMNHIPSDLDWRGSTATGALCPASLLRAQDSRKKNLGSKSKQNMVEIDLNVAENVSDMAIDPALVKEHFIPSRDSSVEVSSGKLNSTGYEEAPFWQSSLMSHRPEKRKRSLSPTSSSSRYTSLRNFDLNENIFVRDGFNSQNINNSNSSFITIMGTKMPVQKADDTNQAYENYVGSGLSWGDFMAGRSLMPCPQQVLPPGYGYSGLGMDPSFPFQPIFYSNSNIPLMAEARSTPIIPHLLSPSYPHGAMLSSQPVLMSITTTPSSSNGVESSNPCLDLNSSTMQMESGDGEARSLYDFFVPAPTNLSEQPTRSTSQPSASRLLLLKRKELA